MMLDLNNPAHPGHSNQLIPTNGLKPSRVWYHQEPMLESIRNKLIDECQLHRTERCGLITAGWDIWKVPNCHEAPYKNYLMCDEDVFPILHEIYEIRETYITAIWHTHPTNVPWPSPRDIVGWPRLDLKWRYFIVTNNEVLEWELT